MHKLLAVFLFGFVWFSGYTQEQTQKKIRVFEKFEDFKHLLAIENDSTYVINFWATWCKPCVAELPIFEKLNQKYVSEKVKVLLVSLDFQKHLKRKVIPFIEQNNIQSEVALLDDPKATYWIDKVDKSWSGAIPATIFYNSKDKIFMEHEFESLEEVESIIKNLKKS